GSRSVRPLCQISRWSSRLDILAAETLFLISFPWWWLGWNWIPCPACTYYCMPYFRACQAGLTLSCFPWWRGSCSHVHLCTCEHAPLLTSDLVAGTLQQIYPGMMPGRHIQWSLAAPCAAPSLHWMGGSHTSWYQ